MTQYIGLQYIPCEEIFKVIHRIYDEVWFDLVKDVLAGNNNCVRANDTLLSFDVDSNENFKRLKISSFEQDTIIFLIPFDKHYPILYGFDSYNAKLSGVCYIAAIDYFLTLAKTLQSKIELCLKNKVTDLATAYLTGKFLRLRERGTYFYVNDYYQYFDGSWSGIKCNGITSRESQYYKTTYELQIATDFDSIADNSYMEAAINSFNIKEIRDGSLVPMWW